MSAEEPEDSDTSVPSPILVTQPIRPVLLRHQHRFSSSVDSGSDSHAAATSEEENSLVGTDDSSFHPSTPRTDFSDNTTSVPSVIYTIDDDSQLEHMSNSQSPQDNDSDVTQLDDDPVDLTVMLGSDDGDDSHSDHLQTQDSQQSDESAGGESPHDPPSIFELSDESSRGYLIYDRDTEGPDTEEPLSDAAPSPRVDSPVIPSIIFPATISPNPVHFHSFDESMESSGHRSPTVEGPNDLPPDADLRIIAPVAVVNAPSTSGIQGISPSVNPVIQPNQNEAIDAVALPETEADPQVDPVPSVEGENRPDPIVSPLLAVPSTSRQADEESSNVSNDAPPCKRPRLNSEGSPVVKVETKVAECDDDESSTCTICLDQWTSSGDHRIVALKCGHLFGFSCIQRWIKNQKPSERKCPTCKTKAKIYDFRNLYAHKIQVLDTTELEELRVKNKELERQKRELTREVIYIRKLNDDLMAKQREAQMQIQQLKTEKMVSHLPPKSSSSYRVRVQLVHTLELSKSEGCRVAAFNSARNIIVASIPSPTTLFQGFSLKIIDAESFRPRQITPAHKKMIRDVAFSNDGKFLLSCGLDRVANVLCMDSNSVIAHFATETPLWSVCWDADNPWTLFTGGVNGIVQQFDIRSPGQEVTRLTTQGDMTPVASLESIPKESSAGWLYGGLISCRLRQLYPYKRLSKDSFEVEPCSIEGTFCSMRYDRRTQHLLVSTRPTQRAPRAQHMAYQMSSGGRQAAPQYNLVQTFLGSTTQGVMSRSCFLPLLNQHGGVDDMLVCSYVESESQVALWSVSNGQKVHGVQSPETITDLCPIHLNGKTYLSSISDKKLRVYKVDRS